MSRFTPPEVVKPELPGIYYDDACKDYWRRDAAGFFMKVDLTSVKRRLKMDGFIPDKNSNVPVSELEETVEKIQTENRIFFAGSLAGHSLGVYETDGRKILVTDSPKIIEPSKGEWPVFRCFVENLLGDQQDYFWGWIKVAYESLRSGKHRPGQVLILAGPRDCGKSMLQRIVTLILGNRVEHPFKYLVEATDFNAHLFGAEHLMIDDQAAGKNFGRRMTFGQNLKGLISGQAQHYHAKYRTPLSLNPFWRITISVNDEPDHLEMLPMMDDSLADKLIILKADRHPMPMPTFTDEERTAFRETMTAELRHMLYDLTMEWEIPEQMRSARFGVTHFHHPDVMAAISDISREARLLDLIDCSLFPTPLNGDKPKFKPWEGRAEELEHILREGFYGREVGNLLTFFRACAQYLSRLAEQQPKRVQHRRVKGVARWIISPPPDDE